MTPFRYFLKYLLLTFYTPAFSYKGKFDYISPIR